MLHPITLFVSLLHNVSHSCFIVIFFLAYALARLLFLLALLTGKPVIAIWCIESLTHLSTTSMQSRAFCSSREHVPVSLNLRNPHAKGGFWSEVTGGDIFGWIGHERWQRFFFGANLWGHDYGWNAFFSEEKYAREMEEKERKKSENVSKFAKVTFSTTLGASGEPKTHKFQWGTHWNKSWSSKMSDKA